jgi:hypothetical protein
LDVTKAMMVLIPLVLAAACSSQAPATRPAAAPQTVAAPQAVAAPQSAATPAAPTTPATPATAATGASPAASAVPNKELLSHGYRMTTIKGQVVYCRSESVTGSAFKNSVCLTEEQIRTQQKDVDSVLRQTQGTDCSGWTARCTPNAK